MSRTGHSLELTQQADKSKSDIERYDMIKSQERLVRDGFHHKVTSKTTLEVEIAWVSMAKSAMNKPARKERAAKYQHNSPLNEPIDTAVRRTNVRMCAIPTPLTLFRY